MNVATQTQPLSILQHVLYINSNIDILREIHYVVTVAQLFQNINFYIEIDWF